MILGFFTASVIAICPTADSPQVPRLPDNYLEVRAKAGRSSEDQVRLALWCEAHGLTAERLNHLTLAVLADPKNATARGLMGLVAHEGRWRRPEVVAAQTLADPNLAQYEVRRGKAPYTAEGQWTLGVWADEHGLKEQAKAHLTAVVRLDPTRENAWKKLGYKKQGGRWITDAQLAANKAEQDAQKLADHKWKPLLDRYKAMLDQPSKRAEAEAALANLTDPRAVPAIGLVFARSDAAQQLRAAQLLGQIDAPGSSKSLAYLSIFGKSAEVRRASTETLRGRDPREYANHLIALIQKPIRFEVKPVGGPGSPGTLFVEGEKANVKRLYEQATALQAGDSIGIDRFGQPVVRRVLSFSAYSNGGRPFNPNYLTGVSVGYEDFFSSQNTGMGTLSSFNQGPLENWTGLVDSLKTGHLPSGPRPRLTPSEIASHMALPVPGLGGGFGTATSPRDFASQTQAEFPLAQAMAESERAALAAQQQLAGDVAMLEARNKWVDEVNGRVVGVLNTATDQTLAADRSVWEKWWVSILGYNQVVGQATEKPTFVEVVPSSYVPQVMISNIVTTSLGVNGVSCFGAGTAVRTADGSRAIETLKVGDLVLTQSTSTGALGYQPILVVHHNPPSATFKITLRGEGIISSHFHRFWVAGRGWVMARDLKVGDPVRTLGGVSPVQAVEADKVQLVYNLDIADDADFFAGGLGALVHDNSLPDPRLAPFDASPKSEAVGVARRAD